MSRFDLILLYIFALILAVCASDYLLITAGHEQYTAGFWTFVTAVCTGEVVTFSLYKIATRKGGKAPKHAKEATDAIKDVEADLEEEAKEQEEKEAANG